jgi:hypothetical protein
MSDGVVAAVLRHIGARAGSGHVWVDVDGRWQIGPLHGDWDKAAAAHIGHSAREAARRRRLAGLAVEIGGAEAELAHLDRESDALSRREQAARREAVAAPTGAGAAGSRGPRDGRAGGDGAAHAGGGGGDRRGRASARARGGDHHA